MAVCVWRRLESVHGLRPVAALRCVVKSCCTHICAAADSTFAPGAWSHYARRRCRFLCRRVRSQIARRLYVSTCLDELGRRLTRAASARHSRLICLRFPATARRCAFFAQTKALLVIATARVAAASRLGAVAGGFLRAWCVHSIPSYDTATPVGWGKCAHDMSRLFLVCRSSSVVFAYRRRLRSVLLAADALAIASRGLYTARCLGRFKTAACTQLLR